VRLLQILMQAEDVALGILEPGRLLRAEHAHVLHGPEPRQVVVGERDAARLQVADGRGDVVDLEAERRVLGLRSFRLGKEGDLRPAAAVDELSGGLRAERLEAELVLVEAAGALEILDGEQPGDLRGSHPGTSMLTAPPLYAPRPRSAIGRNAYA